MPEKPVIEETVDHGINLVKASVTESIDKLLGGDNLLVAKLTGDYIIPATVSLLVVFIGYLAAKYFARIISAPICRRVDETLGKFIGRVTFYGIMLPVTGLVLKCVGLELTGVATILAAAGFAVGLAFQGTLSNFAAGILLLVFRPFKVGDLINAAGMMGKVNEIDLFTTTLDTPDNRRIIIPNSAISGNTIENISFHQHRRVEVIVGVAYGSNLDATRAALTAAAESLRAKMIHGEGRGYAVILATMADSAVQWKVRVWAASSDFFAVNEQLTQAIKQQLDIAGIQIPFPQMDVHLHRVQATETPASTQKMRSRLAIVARDVRREAA